MWGNGGGVAEGIAGPECGLAEGSGWKTQPVSPVNLHRHSFSWLAGIFRRVHGNADPWGDAAAFHTHSHARMRPLSGNPLTNTAAFESFF